MKLRRLIGFWSDIFGALLPLPASPCCGGTKFSTYGWVASPRTL
jgi:hypothetical protein